MSRPVTNPVWDAASEQRVLDAMAQGQTVAQIARAIGHTPNAVWRMLERRKQRLVPPRCIKVTTGQYEADKARLRSVLNL